MGHTNVQLFVLVASLSLLVIDYSILAITKPDDFGMTEEAQGQACQRRMRRVYQCIGYLALSLAGWLVAYVLKGAKHLPHV